MRKLNVLHLNAGTELGGTETMILRFLETADRTRFNFYVAAFFPGGLLLDRAKRLNAETRLFKVSKRYNMLELIVAFIRLCRFLKKNKIDIVHMYGFWTSIFSRVAIKLTKTPIGITGLRTEDNWRRWYHSFLDRATSRWIDLYISVFNKGKELLVNRDRIPANKIVVIHNGIDLAWVITGRGTCPLPIVGMIAAFSSFKAHEELIRAVPKIIEKFPNIKFILVGNGKKKKGITDLITKLNLHSYFIITDFVSDVRPILSMLSVFVLVTHSEGLPVSIIEAMSFGLPVIASKVGGVPELIDDGINGVLISPNKVDQLSSAIIELLQNHDKAKSIGDRAREKIVRDFSIETMSGKVLSRYLSLAESKGLLQ